MGWDGMLKCEGQMPSYKETVNYELETRKCEFCGKRFVPAIYHTYRRTTERATKWFCKYTCMTAYDKSREHVKRRDITIPPKYEITIKDKDGREKTYYGEYYTKIAKTIAKERGEKANTYISIFYKIAHRANEGLPRRWTMDTGAIVTTKENYYSQEKYIADVMAGKIKQ